MLANKGDDEAWPGCKETSIDSGDPGGGNRAEGGFVEILDDVPLFAYLVDIVHLLDGSICCVDCGW